MIDFFFFIYDDDTGTTIPVPVEEKDIDNVEELEFFNDGVRKVWRSSEEEWYFSIVDVCRVLTDSTNPKNYWNMLKSRISEEHGEPYTNFVRLKMPAADGKMRVTDCATTEGLLRIIQSIPSKKAEPFKQWLARVGTERLEEMADPEKAIDRGFEYYRRKGYSEEWIKQRIQSKAIRDELTDEWKRSGITNNRDYAILTNILTQAWSGKTVKKYKEYKGLHKENLRDNMTNLELTLNQLAEVSATALSRSRNPIGMDESKVAVVDGGNIAGNARKELEQKLGHSVISPLNASDPSLLNVKDDT